MNKVMKKWLSALIIGCSLTSVTATHVLADDNAKHNQARLSEHKTSKPAKHPRLRGPMKIIEKLNIDSKKRALVQQIITEQHQKRVKVYQQSRHKSQDKQQKMQQVHQQTIERLSTVLSKEQVKQFEQLLSQQSMKKPAHGRIGKEIN